MSRRSRVFSVLSAFAFVLVAFPATALAGTSQEIVTPPGPSCAEPIFSTPAVLDDNGWNRSVELGDGASGLPTSLTIPGLSYPAGSISLDEVVTWDSHVQRETNTDQTNERIVIDFILNGAVVGSSATSTDLVDGVVSAWEVQNLGVVSLPAGADAVVLRHVGGTASINSVVVTSVCATFVAVATCDDGSLEPDGGCDQVPEEPDCEVTPDAEGCPEVPEEPDCDATPDAEGCPELPEPPATCDDGTPEPEGGCDQVPEAPDCEVTPDAEGCPEVPEEPDCDANPGAEGCPELPSTCDDGTPEPEGGCDQNPAPPLAVTGAYSEAMAAGGMILVLAGGLVSLVATRREN